MKITTRQLRQLIKEEIGELDALEKATGDKFSTSGPPGVATIKYESRRPGVPVAVVIDGKVHTLRFTSVDKYMEAYRIMESYGATMVNDIRVSETPVSIDEWVAILEGEFS